MLTKVPAGRADEVRPISGLRLVADGRARGSIDAVSACRLVLGRSALPSVIYAAVPLPQDKTLRDYQQAGVGWLLATLKEYGGALLADDMGLGKTLQALTVLRLLLDEHQGRALVCCPAAARETWREEVKRWGVKGAVVLSPSKTKASLAAWEAAPTSQIVITSYHHGVVERAFDAAFSKDYPTVLVLDEAHRLRGRFSQRSKALSVISPLCRYRLALTATPQYDRPRDLWKLLNTLLPHTFGSKWDFDVRYCAGHINKWGGMDNRGASCSDELKHRLSFYMLRREKHQVAKELPPLTRQVRWIDPTPEAKRALAAARLGLGKSSLHEALLATLKGKMEEALDLAEEAGRFLLVTWLREHAHQFGKLLTERDVPHVVVEGGLTTERRAALLDLARKKKVGVVATLDSVSESLNLQGLANIGISHGLSWSPLKEAQKEARLHRLGQVDPVTWYYLAMRESADEVVIHTVVEKLEAWSSLMSDRRGKDEASKLKHTLGDAVSSPDVQKAEKEALKQIYAEMSNRKEQV